MHWQAKWRVLVLMTFMVLSSNGTAVAEIALAESLDWMLNDSVIAIKAKIVDVTKVGKPDEKQFEVLTVEPTKMFRGEKRDRFTFIMRNYNGSNIAFHWQRNDLELIFFLNRVSELKSAPAPFDDYEYFLRDDGNRHSCVLLGKSKFYWPMDSPAITRDCKILNKSSEIVEYIAGVPIIPAGRLKRTQILAPADSDASLRLAPRNAAYIVVPDRINKTIKDAAFDSNNRN